MIIYIINIYIYKYIRWNLRVASVVEKMRKNRLGWLGHVMKSYETETVRVVTKMNV